MQSALGAVIAVVVALLALAYYGGGGGGAVTATAILDAAQESRTAADRGKAVCAAPTDEDALALCPIGGGAATEFDSWLVRNVLTVPGGAGGWTYVSTFTDVDSDGEVGYALVGGTPTFKLVTDDADTQADIRYWASQGSRFRVHTYDMVLGAAAVENPTGTFTMTGTVSGTAPTIGPTMVYVVHPYARSIDSITARAAGAGLTLTGNTLNVTHPAAETGAQVNPRHKSQPFRTLDGDGSTAVQAGTVYLITASNAQWQGGSSSEIAAIEINPSQFDLNQNPQLPQFVPGYTGWHSLPDDLVDNAGGSLWAFQRLDNTNANNRLDGEVFRIQVDTLSKNNDGNYVLSNIVHLDGYSFPSGTGYNWQVVAAFAPPSGADAVVGVLAKANLPGDVVYTEELTGKETDRYSSYTNAGLSGRYWNGSWVLATGTTAPTDARLIRQPDIVDGSGVVAVGAVLRTDRDPNHYAAATASTAADYPSGRVIHASIWNRPTARMVITLTGDGTLVGTGTGAYIWAPATWDEVEDTADVVDYGDYFLLASEAPTKLPIDIPAADVLNPPWLRTDGSNVTDETKAAIQGDNESVVLLGTYRVDATNVARYVSFTTPGGNLPNTINIRIPQTDTQNHTDLQRLLQNGAWVEAGTYTVDITTNATVSTLGTGYTFSANYVPVTGAQPTGSTPVMVTVVGEDVHRGEVARQAFKNESPSVAGKGGTAGQCWLRGTGETNAAWGDCPGPATHTGNHTSSTWTTVVAVANTDILAISAVVWRTSSSAPYPGSFSIVAANMPAAVSGQGLWTSRTTDQGARLEWRVSGGNLQVRTQGAVYAGYYVVAVS